MNEKNIENIMMQLVSLNVPVTIEYSIRANIGLQQDHFQILYRQKKGDDCMNTKFYFERYKNEYFCRYYDASLRKEISIPSILLNEVDVNNLHQKMRNVDWDMDLNNVPDETAKNKMLWEKDQGVEKIITDLEQLSETQEGSAIAERLKIKFWIDTPLAYLVPNFNSLRNQIEISQRFYFFEGEEHIRLEEAYRFLSHKWLEKQLYARKKQEENETVHADSNTPALNEGKPSKKKFNHHVNDKKIG